MATLADALGEGLTGEPHMSGWNFADHVEFLVGQLGSGRELARQLGRAESTIRGWRHGRKPRDHNLRQWVIEMARDVAVQSWRGWPTNHASLSMKATVRYSNDERTRVLNIGRHIPPHKIDAVLDRWAAGEDQAAANDLNRAIRDDYAEVTIVDVKWISWTPRED